MSKQGGFQLNLQFEGDEWIPHSSDKDGSRFHYQITNSLANVNFELLCDI
jgi:hypothetical protein